MKNLFLSLMFGLAFGSFALAAEPAAKPSAGTGN